MSQQPNYQQKPPLSPVRGDVRPINRNNEAANLPTMLILSVIAHLLVVGGTALIILILQFFGFTIPFFDPLSLKPRDIEFVLVDNQSQPPRDKNTKNRAEHMSRSGGEKINKNAKELPMKKAGQPSPKPKPAQPAAKPTPKPQPKKAAKKPTPKPKKVAKTSPPAPKLPTPKPIKKATPALPPNPIAPTIKTPKAPTPKAIAAGPVVNTPVSKTGMGRAGAPMPTQIPGTVSARRSPSSGRSGAPSGHGGSNRYTQAGAPGGGGGRPGIDALPEPDYGAYMAELQRRIKRNWHPPSAQEDKRVVVNFRISRDGRLLSLNVERSSGYTEADQAALGAVRLSAPFRPLPPNHRDNDLSIQFTFDYNVYKNRGNGISYR